MPYEFYDPTYTFKQQAASLLKPAMDIRVTKEGDWHKVMTFVKWLTSSGLASGIKRDLAKAQRDHLHQYKWVLINALESAGSSIQRPFAPWGEAYSKVAGSNIGIRSGNYQDALYGLSLRSSSYMVSIEFPQGAMRQKSEMPSGRTLRGAWTMARYSLAFEQGTSLQPERPLWSASWQHMGGTQALVRKMNGAVGRRLNEMGIKFN